MASPAAPIAASAGPSGVVDASRPWTVEGPEGAPAFVFVHGAVVGQGMWLPQIERLRDRYRCVTVDLPGHGAQADVPYSIAAGIGVVQAAIREAAGGRAVVVGLSLGGYTAMATAAADPTLVRGLVVAGASAEPTGFARLAYLWYGWSLRLLPTRLARAVAIGLFRRAYGHPVAAAIGRSYDARTGGRAVCHLAGQAFRPRLRAYGGPILILNGELDAWFRIGERAFVAGIADLRVVRIAGASHLSNLDQPDRFSAEVAAFERSLSA
ncbi:MAG TPA: alpha/beta fold hydrolase [Candidatus Limnocylindrales bacterium]|nr:alpha/beta fold hydrolase [Candidatus Limnocylindrales bacterium]